jgi:cystathionine gamma-synthase
MTSDNEFSEAATGFAPLDEMPLIVGDSRAEEPLALLDRELRADAARRLQQAMERMDRFLRREESRRLGDTDPTRVLCHSLIEQGHSLLRGALYPETPHSAEATLRSAYRLIGALAILAAWSAPASQESCVVNSFPLAAPRDAIAYARYGCPDTAAQEVACSAQLGLDPARCRVLLTSSGMAAYALIESFLLRYVLRATDRVLLDPGVYFETQEQLRTLPFMNVIVAPGATRRHMLDAIVAHRPKVVFVDPITNCADLNLIDMPRLLAEAARLCDEETWFVVDGTLLSGGFDAFRLARSPHIRVLYYESGCKYLQCGMDLGPAGIVAVEPSLAPRFEHLRRGIGAIAAEPMILPRVSRSAYLAYLRAQTTSAHAAARAVGSFTAQSGERRITALFPGATDHPDHGEMFGYPHLGGLLALRFLDVRLNRRRALETFIDRLVLNARAANLPLTAGVSFGFRVPRITAAWSSYDDDQAFLRLSAGVRTEIASRVGRLIAQTAAESASSPLIC